MAAADEGDGAEWHRADVAQDFVPSFEQLGLSDTIVRGLRDAGFKRPSPIQAHAIPLGRFGVDLIAQAKSGTGKTVAFAVIALEGLEAGASGPQALIVAPTREIAVQTSDVCKAVGAHARDVRCATFIGGRQMRADVAAASACQIACGTPGRIVGLLLCEAIIAERVRMLVLDEADKLVEHDFEPQLRYLLTALPARKQTLAFSATYPPALLSALRSAMRSPHSISVVRGAESDGSGAGGSAGGGAPAGSREVASGAKWGGEAALVGVRQLMAIVRVGGAESAAQGSGDDDDAADGDGDGDGDGDRDGDGGGGGRAARGPREAKLRVVLRLLETVIFHQAMIFTNDRHAAADLASRLSAAGFPSASISGGHVQSERTSVVRAFRDLKLRVLVTSDLLARGVDFGHVSLVIHLEPPRDMQTYLHRVGRTGRYGARGASCLLLLPREWAAFAPFARAHELRLELLPPSLRCDELVLSTIEHRQLGEAAAIQFAQLERGRRGRGDTDGGGGEAQAAVSEAKAVREEQPGGGHGAPTDRPLGAARPEARPRAPADVSFDADEAGAAPLVSEEQLAAARARGRQRALEKARERVRLRTSS